MLVSEVMLLIRVFLVVLTLHEVRCMGTSGEMGRKKCQSLYGKRRYLTPAEQSQIPALIYTFPGSGNTWVRLLVEYATGIYTGSLYNDVSIMTEMPGERYCSYAVSAIKAHPNHFTASTLLSRDDTFEGEVINKRARIFPKKCLESRSPITHFGRAVYLMRDPFASIYSETMRQVKPNGSWG